MTPLVILVEALSVRVVPCVAGSATRPWRNASPAAARSAGQVSDDGFPLEFLTRVVGSVRPYVRAAPAGTIRIMPVIVEAPAHMTTRDAGASAR